MKIKGRYEIELDRKDWWFLILLMVLIVGMIIGSMPVNNFLVILLEKIKTS